MEMTDNKILQSVEVWKDIRTVGTGKQVCLGSIATKVWNHPTRSQRQNRREMRGRGARQSRALRSGGTKDRENRRMGVSPVRYSD